MTDTIELRPFSRDEFAAATELVELAFMLQGRPEDREVFAAVLEFERSLGAFAGARMVGTAAAHSFELTVPGGTAPAGGVTIVTVHPAHRRRGILSSMMDRQLADLHEGGEAIAVLRASEASIYSRFGYATASRELSLDLDRWAATLVPDAPADKALSLDLADPAQVRDELAAVYDAVRAGTPGFIGRSGPAWADVLHDPDHRRGGATALRAALVGDGTTTSGYATYRVRENWDDNGLPTGSVIVEELVASTPAAAAALWRHVLDLDLTSTISLGTRPVDEPLLRLLANPRRARAQVFDSLWLRLVRLGEALAARRYAAPGRPGARGHRHPLPVERRALAAGRRRVRRDLHPQQRPGRPAAGHHRAGRCLPRGPGAGRPGRRRSDRRAAPRRAAPAGHLDGLEPGSVVPPPLLNW